MIRTKKYALVSLGLSAVALLDAIGSLLGFWSVTATERNCLLVLEGTVLLGLLLNSSAITRWVFRQTQDTRYRRVACLSLVSLLLCIGGDIVNFNIPEVFYRHGDVVMHDYLADSVWFFSPGYLLLVAAVLQVARIQNVKISTMAAVLALAIIAAISSFLPMHLANTGSYVTVLTAIHAVVITMVGFSAILLLMALGGIKAPANVWMVATGLLLACVADALIGNFWIYGNNGTGHYPDIRYINWFIYIGSQALVIHLPYVLLVNKAKP